MKYLASIKEDLKKKTRYSTYAFVSIWKMIFFIGSTVFIFYIKGGSVSTLFTLLPQVFQPHKITVSEVKTNFLNMSLFFLNNSQVKQQAGTLPDLQDITFSGDTRDVDAANHAAIYVLLIHVFSAYLCYVFGKYTNSLSFFFKTHYLF